MLALLDWLVHSVIGLRGFYWSMRLIIRNKIDRQTSY
jgi:hypothetical protein